MTADPSSHYRLESVLGQGGAATTWKAVDTRTGQACVLKKLHLPQLASWKDFERFEREVGALRHLEHAAIPRFLDAWQSQEPPEAVLVQEYLPGLNLKQWVESGRRFTEAEVVAIAAQLADVLAYLHGFASPIVHRDLKPSNILLDQGNDVHLIDFGAVPASLGGEGLTVSGTFGYMPLEQAEGRAVPASDLYALGATLVYLLTGCAPAELPRRGLRIDFRARCQVSARLGKLLDKLLAPDLVQRFQRAEDVCEALRRLQKKPGGASPLARLRAWTRVLNWPQTALMLGLLVIGLLVAGAALRLWLPRPANQAPQAERPPGGNRPQSLIGEFGQWQPATAPWQRLEPPLALIALAEAPDGEVWGLAGDRLARLGAQPQFWPNHALTGSYSPLTQLAVSGTGELWFGNYEGKLYHWPERQLGLPGPVAAPGADQKLGALGSWRGQVVAAWGSGLWRWTGTAFEPLGRIPEPAEVLAGDGEGRLWAAAGRNLYRYGPDGWRLQLVTGSVYADRIRSLAAGGDQLWLGLEKGLIEFSLKRDLSASLSKEGPITAVVGGSGQPLWLSNSDTYATGLLRLRANERQPRSLGWREGLPADRFEALLLDRRGQLWASAGITSGGDLVRAPLTAIEALLDKPPAVGVIPGQSYKSACAAWDALRPEASRQLAGETRGELLRVFWNGRQVCPYGDGYRRGDGALLVVAEGKLQLWRGTRIELRALPEKHVSIHDLLLDASDRAWLSRTYPYSVEREEAGGWRKLEQGFSARSQVQLLETRGGVLLAAVEVEDQLPLQRFSGEGWTALGLGAGRVTPRRLLELRSGELALATDKGLYLLSRELKQARRVEGLPYQDLQALSEDAQGRLWIVYNPYGQGRGLSVWDPGKDRVSHLDSRGGLVPDRFENLAIDARQRVWLMGGQQAVSVYESAALAAGFEAAARRQPASGDGG